MTDTLFTVACIPAYNEEKTISDVCAQTCKYVDAVIICNDGSTDKTREILDKTNVIVKNHYKHLGKGSALKTLFKAAIDIKADIIVTLDADGQHLPEEIPKLITQLLRPELKADMVIGSRFSNNTHGSGSSLNYAGNRLFNFLIYLFTARHLTDTQCGFRVFKKELLNELATDSKDYEIESELTIKALKQGYKIVEIPIICGKTYRASRLHSFRDGLKILTTIIITSVTSDN